MLQSVFRPQKAIEVPRVHRPKSLLLEDLQAEYKPLKKPLIYAVAGGSVPPPGGDDLDKFIYKKPLTPQQIQKIKSVVGDSNSIASYFHSLIKNCNKIIK